MATLFKLDRNKIAILIYHSTLNIIANFIQIEQEMLHSISESKMSEKSTLHDQRRIYNTMVDPSCHNNSVYNTFLDT